MHTDGLPVPHASSGQSQYCPPAHSQSATPVSLPPLELLPDPDPDPESDPESDPDPDPESDPDSEPDSDPDSDPDPDPDPDSDPELLLLPLVELPSIDVLDVPSSVVLGVSSPHAPSTAIKTTTARRIIQHSPS
jgi:hypothetical protein